MAISLREISIRGIHGKTDVRIPIIDNRLVLVGVNGLGKTTVVNILYYFLSKQWHKLSEVPFNEIAISLGRRKLRINREMLAPPQKIIKKIFAGLPPSARSRVERDPAFYNNLVAGRFDQIESEHGIPASFFSRSFGSSKSMAWQASIFGDDENDQLADITKYIDENISAQILYLPTYRRIEQDFRSLLPHFDEDIQEVVSRQLRRYKHRDRAFVELVQFGMEDVQVRISDRLDSIKEQVRVELNELAGRYLRDVIRGEAERYRRADIEALDDEEVERILSRVEERTLPASDKERLREVIRGIRSEDGSNESAQERYLAHFFSKLVETYRSQQTRESTLREFADVCNKYLQGKQLEYDDVEYTLKIKSEGGNRIELGHLSSGEKQIVSLFSHVYLSGADSFYIIIDEPELSLSVEWQKRLLPDLANSGRCEFIAAVTHSPFIFDNEFDGYAMDLRACATSQ